MHYLSQYQSFDSVQELNHHVKQHTNRRYHDMNETQRQVLQLISQYSVKFAGASHLRIQTIADAIGKSRRTVERAIRVLIDLNVIERLNTTRRVSGGKGANIYRILPCEERDVASEVSHCEESAEVTAPKDNAPITEKESANLLSYNSNIHTRDGNDAAKRGLRSAIPTQIYEALTPYFDAKGMYDTYGILLRAKASVDRKITLEEYADDYIDEYYNVIRKYKRGEVRSLNGLLYSAWQRVTAEISRRRALAAGKGLASLFAEVLEA